MDAFKLHNKVIENYRDYLRSFLKIKDRRIRKYVEERFDSEGFIPEPIIQFNPSYQRDETLKDLNNKGLIHKDLIPIFGTFRLYKHQIEAIKKGIAGNGYIVTSGTGSGKSLTFLATIFNSILSSKNSNKGIKAIIVYPMNALINSQKEEIQKYEYNYLIQNIPLNHHKEFDPKSEKNKNLTLEDILKKIRKQTGKSFPVTYEKYTGQEGQEDRDKIKNETPDIILTNYMMLELIMTRESESWMRKSIKDNLSFLVFDELHTYRGRKGSDVSFLIRRIKDIARQKIVCIGTSATMTTAGTQEDKRMAVADVASTIFGEHFNSSQIIGEYLENCTNSNVIPSKEILGVSVNTVIDINGNKSEFIKHPLSIWLENRVALIKNNRGLTERGTPLTLSEIVKLLSKDSGQSESKCKNAITSILQWAEKLNLNAVNNKFFNSFLPFKLHQFISQTSTVYVTLEPKEKRKISLETGRYVKVDSKDQFIYPLLFSRYSGHEFICVTKDFEKKKFLPRDPSQIPVQITKDDLKGDRETGKLKRKLTEEDFTDGYIIIPDNDDEALWTDDNIEDLPQSWWKVKKGNIEIDNYYKYRLPSKIYFDNYGNFSNEPKYDQWGWFMPVKLLFDPTAGLIYDLKTNENTKLMRLGNEGRSTATTITAYSVIRELFYQNEKISNQKLLSFTDNRQDASLQAGHFNDFINVGRLRSALYFALKNAKNNKLKAYELADHLVLHLNLKESDFIRGEANDDWPDPENERALKKYLLIRIFNDLKRGWRFNLPNLEQTALLTIEYERLDDFCKRDDFFKDVLLFNNLTSNERKEIFIQFLNFFRTSYALDHPLITSERSETEAFIQLKLDPDKQWSLDKNEKIEVPVYMVSRNPGDTQRYVYTASLGPNSYIGKYFKRLFKQNGLDTLHKNEYSDFIDSVCQLLKKANLLTAENIRGKKDIVTGYRLRIDNIIWKIGDEKTVLPDEIRISSYKKQLIAPNKFFQNFYKTDFTTFTKQFIGKEHTGQLKNEDRILRENNFKDGSLSALFCSPTMELGIDIADLNIVHMRNVPPSPANYVQRSGRAGRSGQTAVVFTYCSSWSPHDRHYFKKPAEMVAGSVVPPRIDLLNEELVITHFNSFILMHIGLSDLNISVNDVIDTRDKKSLPLKQSIVSFIKNQESFYQNEWIDDFKNLVKSSIPGIEKTNWYTDEWLISKATSFLSRFDKAFDRWRILFKMAEDIIQKARKTMDDPTVKQNSPIMKEAKRQHNIGLAQRNLLKNDLQKSFGNESEFYVFRYLASEGFLPGYNFTRLPVRAFVGYKHQDAGEYISRARFIALREFGPNNLIYHNGNKYRINRMLLADASLKMRKIKISKETGYAFLDDEGEHFNNDPITNNQLRSQSSTEIINNLVELSETEAIPQERISCEEEERTRTGFQIDQFFSYPKGIESTSQSLIKEGEQPLLRLIFNQATRLIQINRHWRRSKDSQGFLIDDRNGKWLRKRELSDNETEQHAKDVRLMARDSADTLYIQPVKDLGINTGQVVSLAFALKRGIESLFEVEESEIGVWIMGNDDEPNIMIYEASQGSLGVLSQLIESPSKMKSLFTKAYSILHFNPETYEDTKPDLPKATYDDLLSYYNQRYHELVDRFSIKETLERLMKCEVSTVKENKDREEQYQYLLEKYDKSSSTELKLLQFLYNNNYALPDKAQVNIKECYANADFVYKTSSGPVLVFCDGSVHDNENVILEDNGKRRCLRDHGYDLIEWHYSEPLEKLIERRKDIFRKL